MRERERERERRITHYYEESYSSLGVAAQRRYPNEALIRFVAGNFPGSRQGIRILEAGCGSGANLGMLLTEGFDVYGLDLSPTAIELCRQTVSSCGKAHLYTGDMVHTDFEANFFDAVCDVLSACCLPHDEYIQFLKEICRILKKGGLFFFYTPCTSSRAFTDHAPAQLIDAYTLDGIKRPDSPYYGNDYPLHFLDAGKADDFFEACGFLRISLERYTRTYNHFEEPFSCLAGVYRKE